MNSSLQVRVNGVLIQKLTFRRKMRDGYPDGPWEIVVHDVVLGPFSLTDDFEIEMKQCRQPWAKVHVNELLTTLEGIGAN